MEEDGRLRYVGGAGTGFSVTEMARLKDLLDKERTKGPPPDLKTLKPCQKASFGPYCAIALSWKSAAGRASAIFVRRAISGSGKIAPRERAGGR
jgi:hypothetical protein